MAGTERFPTGLIVGRFDPPHHGHSFMIDWAAQRCSRLVVFVNSSAERDAAPGELRASWLAELHPEVTVQLVRHRLGTDFDDEELWAQWMALFRSQWPHDDGPHAVFSSDGYVDALAERFGAEAVVVDAERNAVPISATEIRTSPADHLHRLAPRSADGSEPTGSDDRWCQAPTVAFGAWHQARRRLGGGGVMVSGWAAG